MTVTAEVRAQPTVSRRSVASGTLWIAASGVVLKLANVAITAGVAHVLTPADFGVFAVAAAVFLVVGGLADLGMGAAIVRATDDVEEIAPTVATLALGTAAALAAAMFFGATGLAAALGEPAAASALRILAGCLVLNGLFAVPSAQLTRTYRQRRLFVANVVAFVPANVALVLLAQHGGGADAFAWSRIVGQVVVGLIVVHGVQHFQRPGFSPVLARRLLLFGIPIAFANLVNWTLLNADYLLVAHALTAAEVGAYMLAFTVASWPTVVLGGVLNGVVIPSMARVEGHERGAAIVTAVRLVSLCALPVGFLVLALAQPVVAALYGAHWSASVGVLQVLAGYGMAFAYCLLAANVLVAFGRSWRLLAVQLVWLAVLVPVMLLLLGRAGIVGVGWAHVVVIALIVPLYLLGLAPELRGHGRALLAAVAPVLGAAALAGVVAAGVARLVHGSWTALLLGGASGATVYLALMARAIAAHLPERSR